MVFSLEDNHESEYLVYLNATFDEIRKMIEENSIVKINWCLFYYENIESKKIYFKD